MTTKNTSTALLYHHNSPTKLILSIGKTYHWAIHFSRGIMKTMYQSQTKHPLYQFPCDIQMLCPDIYLEEVPQLSYTTMHHYLSSTQYLHKMQHIFIQAQENNTEFFPQKNQTISSTWNISLPNIGLFYNNVENYKSHNSHPIMDGRQIRHVWIWDWKITHHSVNGLRSYRVTA